MHSRINLLLIFVFTFLCFLPLKVLGSGEQRLAFFIKEHPDISKFFDLLPLSPFLKSAILWKHGTLFVPKNEAIDDYLEGNKRQITNTTLLYHFSNFAMPLSELEQESSISTEMLGNSPIWITKTKKGIFLNDAKYIVGNFRVVFGDRGGGQSSSATIVHIIDRVLEATAPGSVESYYLENPDAGKYLENMGSFDVSDTQLGSTYFDEVRLQGKLELYKQPGFQTFFIPVNEAFKTRKANAGPIDNEVIFGHIIPRIGVFLRTIDGNGEEYETYKPPTPMTTRIAPYNVKTSATPTFSVIVSFEKIKMDGKDIWLVNSDNRQGDEKHRKGVVQAEIIKGNIPVKNGVVHLISKPLVVIDMNVYQTLEWYGTKQHIKSMGLFFQILRKLRAQGFGGEIQLLLQGQQNSVQGITLFVPSNEAIVKCSELQQRKDNMTALVEILKTHILQETISAEDMTEHSKMKTVPFQIQSALPGRKLLFSSYTKDGNRTIHLEGGGVNATVIHADFGATNGFIHIIDNVLGIPDQTLLEKLRTHPMLQTTYQLWRKGKLNERFNRTQEPITLFAPSETAWINLRRFSEHAFHNLFHTTSMNLMLTSVLERHIIVEQFLTIEDLRDLSLKYTNATISNETNLTISRYPIKTLGERGYVKVNESKTILSKQDTLLTTTTTQLPTTQQETTATTTTTTTTTTTASPPSGLQESHYYVYWNRMWAHVVRTNVKCTNGIIHIIDDVLMDSEEITVAAAPVLRYTSIIFISMTLFSIYSLVN